MMQQQVIGYDYMGRPIYGAPPASMQPQQMQMPQTMPASQQPSQPQIRNGGIVSVPNEEVARAYRVAAGYTVTMRDENAPYLYEKTMPFSQLEQPIFRKARIVFEDTQQSTQDQQQDPKQPAAVYAELAQLEALRDAVVADIRDLHKQLDKESAEIRSLVAAMIKPADESKKPNKKKEADEE